MSYVRELPGAFTIQKGKAGFFLSTFSLLRTDAYVKAWQADACAWQGDEACRSERKN